MAQQQLNVFGLPITVCSCKPLTGFYRTGHCIHTAEDEGKHTVCAIMDKPFLVYSLLQGNDLSTPRPEWNFPGLQPGDQWCLSVNRWRDAYHAAIAPQVNLEATNERVLEVVPLDVLLRFAYKR